MTTSLVPDCGGTVNSQGVCSCEVRTCDDCGGRWHMDSDEGDSMVECIGGDRLCTECHQGCRFGCFDEAQDRD